MVSISFGAKVGLLVIGAGIIATGVIVFTLTYTWWGSWFDSMLFLFLFLPMGMLPMLAAAILGTKPKYPSQFYPYYQTQIPQYPQQPQDMEYQQKFYKQMYDQAYQYGYQQGYMLGLQKAYEQLYKLQGQQVYQYYQPYYQHYRR
ncbi:hypothetical protein KEJ51_05960 [Candidatus Bathyarchaeota archaeon]|nr:hypothetical protein [Candidatus Bathyarchaeota archaeon]